MFQSARSHLTCTVCRERQEINGRFVRLPMTMMAEVNNNMTYDLDNDPHCL